MGRSYSLDLRVRVAAFVAAGHSRRAAARHFGVSDSFAIKLLRRQAQSGSAAPARQGRPRGGGKLAPYEAFLVQTVEAEPDITMPELAARLMNEHGVVAAPATLSRFLCRRGFTYKKIPDGGGVRTRRHSRRAPRLDGAASAPHAAAAASAGLP
jgi:transposase